MLKYVRKGTLITTQEKIDLVKGQADEDAFKAEFSRALADLMSKVQFRGIAHYEWIGEQMARSLSENPALHQHILEHLARHDRQEKESA